MENNEGAEIRPKISLPLERRFHKRWYHLALYLALFAGTFFQNELAIDSLVSQLNYIFSDAYGQLSIAFVYVFRFLAPLIHLLVFELISRFVYMYTNRLTFGAVGLTAPQFVSALRLFVILGNLAFGIFNLLFYFYNFLIPLGQIVLRFFIMTAAYFLFYLYIDKHYLDPKGAHRVFRAMAILYLTFSLLNLLGGLLL
jgi:hypothetical protein